MRRSWLKPSLLWRKLRLPYKLGLVYTPLILLPALAGIYYVTESYTTSSKASTSAYANDLLSLMVQKIDDRMGSYEQLSKQVMTDADLLRLVKAEPSTVYERFQLENAISEKLNVLWLGADQNSYIRAIKIATPDTTYTYGKDTLEQYRIDNPEYRAAVGEMKGAARWFPPETYNDGYVQFAAFRLGRSIRDERLRELGVLTLVIRVEAVSDIFGQTRFQDEAALKLLADDGRVLVDNGVVVGPEERQLLSYSDRRIRNGWSLSAQLPLQRLYEPIYETVRLALFIVLGCIVLGLVVTHLLTLDLVIPIRRLMVNMKQGIKGVRPNELQHFGGAIEIVEMNDTFISVMYEIEQLIDEVARQEKKKKNAEIRVLQNQLSPHFLHNTLNSIRWMAMIQKQDNIKEMVDSLNQLLVYALRGSSDEVSLADELAMLANYATIQQVRYRHFEFVTRVPDELRQSAVLKFLLQPLIENALIHGLALSERPGTIVVEAREQGDQLQLVVRDNGVGIEADKRERLAAGLSRPHDQFGLHSVQERVQLHYGQKFGVAIESEPGSGTAITVRIPLRNHAETGGDSDAQRNDRR